MEVETTKKFDMITVGSDPEFVVMLNGRMNHAQQFFTGLSGNANRPNGWTCDDCGESGGGNCDSCSDPSNGYTMGIDVGESGNIGWDGRDDTGEMRPRYSDAPAGHVEHIANLLRYVASRNKVVKLAAVNSCGRNGIGVVPTGGHIHLGHPGAGLTNAQLERIFKMFSTLMLPIVFADGGKEYAVKRISGLSEPNDSNFRMASYGTLSDWRSEQRGRYSVHEFRALTSSWIATRELAYATLATAGAVFEGLAKLSLEDPGKLRKLYERLSPYMKTINTLHRLALLDEENVLFTGFSRRIRKEMRVLPTYEKWKTEIEHALDRRWQKQQVRKGGEDVLTGWGLKTANKTPLYAIQRKFSIPENALRACLESYAPSHGSDTNVSNYALEFAKASKILGWALKKQIHLYGIKAGANAYVIMNANREGFVSKNGPGKITEENLSTAHNVATNIMSGMRTVAEKRNLVAIGIPYELREKNDMRGFLELIWRADNGALKMTDEWKTLVTPEPIISTTNEGAVCAE